KDAIKELVIISELNELMDLEFNPDNYTKQSWQNYIDSLDNAKKVIKDGTQEEVNEATEILRNAIESLVIYEDADIRDVIEEMKLIREEDYTEKSYRELQDAIEKAIKDLELKNPEINRSNIQEMLNKRNGLVNVRSLKEMIHKAEKYDSELYTRDSYNKLEQSLLEANDNIINGSKESVEKALENLETAINGLVQNADELEDYRNTIVLKNPEIYTEETYKAYLEAYEAIMELEIGNTPKQEFQKLKEEFEIARDSLIIKRADYSRLEETLSKVPVDLSIYTNESVAKLEKLLDSIDYDLDITQQDKLDKLVNEIDKAISDLVAIPLDDDKDNGKDTEKPKEPETPKEPTKPGEPEEPTDVEPEQDKDKLPKTGETLFNMASVGIGLLLIALIMVKNRKRADYKNMDK
ncbi:MAG TPA: LPXTG cell wall anchor domain-containing protein, partial [Tissierellaceae bacterium]|nr:LPXTG cell wall anchor domain-containing protein [Tissierellaceae bacterium]